MPKKRVEAYPLKVRELATVDTCAGKPIGDYIVEVLSANSLTLEDRDVLVIASKLVSVFEGRTIRISQINPSLRARLIGKAFSKDQKKLELILREGRVQGVVPMKQIHKIPSMWAKLSAFTHDPEGLDRMYDTYSTAFMVKRNGVLLDDAGIDVSNVPEGCAALLPIDADVSAEKIRGSVCRATGKEVAVIVTDTSSVLGKVGGQDIALGCAGLDPRGGNSTELDAFGQPLRASLQLIADPLAGLGGLLMGQGAEATPICLIRGYEYSSESEEEGMKAVFYPRGTMLRSALLVVLATVFYYLLYVLTLPFGPRKETNQRHQIQNEKKA